MEWTPKIGLPLDIDYITWSRQIALYSVAIANYRGILKASREDLKVDQTNWEGYSPLDYTRSSHVERKVIYKVFSEG